MSKDIKKYCNYHHDMFLNTEVTREVICADACQWLQQQSCLLGSVFTSLPDISEINHLFHGNTRERIVQYETWFVDTATQIMRTLPDTEYAIFLQSDVRTQDNDTKEVIKWIDKSYLCTKAANNSGCTLLWHKLVYVSDIEARSAGRPNYSHLLCYGKGVSYNSGEFFVPDIFSRGGS